MLGAGREKKDDTIDMSAGIIMHKKTGDFVKKGDSIATLYTCNEGSFPSAEKTLLQGIELSPDCPPAQPLVFDII